MKALVAVAAAAFTPCGELSAGPFYYLFIISELRDREYVPSV
jgi:hypothetical protein